jgi:hypothetical protein
MPRINIQDFDFEDYEAPSVEPIRRSTEPVNGKHDLQRRAENGINRFRKDRQSKENNR